MGATTILTGTIPTDFARSLSSPDVGTEVKAEDVQTGEQTLLNNDKLVCDGNPTVNGAWTYSGTNVTVGHATITVSNPSGSQAILAESSGNGAAVQGGASGANGNAGLFISSGGADAVVALATAGNGNGATCTGHGTGSGTVGQGGANGNGGTFTGGASSGHGVAAISQDVNSAALIATAATGGNAIQAHLGPIYVDTVSPTTPPANTIFADKLVAAKAAVTVNGASVSGSFTNCTVTIDGTDPTKLNVLFNTNMANNGYSVTYGEGEYSTGAPPPIMKALTVRGSKFASGFVVRVYSAVTGAPINFATDPGAVPLDITVVGNQ